MKSPHSKTVTPIQLSKDQLAILVDTGDIIDFGPGAFTVTTNALFQADGVKVYDSDCDNVPNPQPSFMANISSYGSDVLAEVHNHDNMDNNMINQDGIFCQRCTYKSYGKGTHHGYNCPPKVQIISNPEPCHDQNIDEFPQTLPSFHPTCCSGDENSFTYDLTPNLVNDSPNIFNPPSQPPMYSYEFYGDDAHYSYDFLPKVPFIYNLEPDNESFSNEDILKEIYSNPLFYDEIISIKIDPHHLNAESDLTESLLNQDSLIISSSKIDSLLDEFTGELILLKSIPPRIDEADCDPGEEILLIEKLLYDNSSPRPPEEINYDAVIEYFSPSPILVEDNDSLIEEIDLSLTPNDSMPIGIKNDDYDSEGDILILEELLSNDSLLLPENESFHFDIP
nr:hypothetical protein [Tanacetum cinerariifolium]